jgi:hypothetical protein
MAVLVAIAFVVACEDPERHLAKLADPAPPAGPTSRTIDVGAQRIALTLPAKWSHTDKGTEQVFKRSIGVISVEDLGPVTPDGIYEAIQLARDAFHAQQLERAQQILKTVDLRGAVGDWNWGSWKNAWNEMRWAGPSRAFDVDEVEAAYEEILSRVFRLAEPNEDQILDEAIRRIGHDNDLREIASHRELTVDGQTAWLVETWSRRHHDWRRSHLIVNNEGFLLVAQMELGTYEELGPAFGMLVETMKLPG